MRHSPLLEFFLFLEKIGDKELERHLIYGSTGLSYPLSRDWI